LKIEFKNTPIPFARKESYIKILWEKILDIDKERGIKLAGYNCKINQANFRIKKHALQALGKI